MVSYSNIRESSVVMVEEGNVEEALDMVKAKEVGDVLAREYPGHLWVVLFQGRALVVKNLAISSFYGFVIKHADSFSAADLARKAVAAGGELLERARMPRGPWNGEFAQTLDGSDKRFFRGTT